MTFDATLTSASVSLCVFFFLITESGAVSFISLMPRQTLGSTLLTWSCSVYCHVESIGNLTCERRRVCVSGSASCRQNRLQVVPSGAADRDGQRWFFRGAGSSHLRASVLCDVTKGPHSSPRLVATPSEGVGSSP